MLISTSGGLQRPWFLPLSNLVLWIPLSLSLSPLFTFFSASFCLAKHLNNSSNLTHSIILCFFSKTVLLEVFFFASIWAVSSFSISKILFAPTVCYTPLLTHSKHCCLYLQDITCHLVMCHVQSSHSDTSLLLHFFLSISIFTTLVIFIKNSQSQSSNTWVGPCNLSA